MASRHRIDEYQLQVWNGEFWALEGTYPEEHIDDKMNWHKNVMPNCPVRIVGIVYLECHDPRLGDP